eukprot:CAMPEP_0113474340 /NCGR_PEP_ID=MMETSP0014_2-20120614/18531_1 /TAXON_ID=2857 /ORGANISM="Nitzschia sp." /LENGTH=51 /DNA_ID=CAMNT_0000367179 /DNA_START=9 /DNA_END=164 /DNA_ORIENTATION=- /assembly_acc=CAM_ASM_000159
MATPSNIGTTFMRRTDRIGFNMDTAKNTNSDDDNDRRGNGQPVKDEEKEEE